MMSSRRAESGSFYHAEEIIRRLCATARAMRTKWLKTWDLAWRRFYENLLAASRDKD
jgi:hypothetical protein